MQGPEGGDEIKQPSEDHRGQVFFKQLWPSKGRPSGKGKWPQKEGYEHKKEWWVKNSAISFLLKETQIRKKTLIFLSIKT